MSKQTEPIILFYPTGIVHFRNLEILKKHLPQFHFQVIIEPWVTQTAAETLENIDPQDQVMVENNIIPPGYWEKSISSLLLSMAYPNRFRLHLVEEATKRNIPVIAVEEVNQLALNDNIINHYFLPLDVLAVPSEVEKKRFLDLGLKETNVQVVGWPFFNSDAIKQNPDNTQTPYLTAQYHLPKEKKLALLILGSLKEHDITSLETQEVRHHILETTAQGLSQDFQLLIKPHPIETAAGIEAIKNLVPQAIIINPKEPIEPLITQADLIINRGNSQVALLALLQNKPLIVIPAGLKTIFHASLPGIIANDGHQFQKALEIFFADTHTTDTHSTDSNHTAADSTNANVTTNYQSSYQSLLEIHFPISQEMAIEKLKDLITTTIKKKNTKAKNKHLYIAVISAFLGIDETAEQALSQVGDHPLLGRLKKLFDRTISVEEFKRLLNEFSNKILRWHLQALFLRAFMRTWKKQKQLFPEAAALVKGFHGEVNPHYFIDDLLLRIELDYQAGNRETAAALIKKFSKDYAASPFYKQAFDMLSYVYNHPGKRARRKAQWPRKNLDKAYTRNYLKKKLKSLVGKKG